MFSDNLRRIRIENKINQRELAKKLNVTQETISYWETGKRQPTLDKLVKLSKIFNISIDDLLK
ncbi:DNA-binding transcriptional regulator, XRE-family HTH domain [Marinitoga hydrogenitolerans DSM 16785]|uniref:DNA-binding transcriptional regulator, XRE-family HTH domain n=1 Tax=Marinitoga hydrogenitolerans (strain DSM 16785 / JCM 12826 / AT1271) TaxID=1122195 RepID=A0A1M4TSE5_MARH1|nr:helix-turn-helix transcriptional regulator [Marinitoga hydrogenitolerans]SHE47315.1 DNA-binding transcriptional regulator, XRE-family HTH domain [Marinitoga hydrogenitolerans DSM 16785]